MTKSSQIQIQLPISSLFTLHGSRLLPPLMSSMPLVVAIMCRLYTLKSDLYIDGIKVTYVTPLVAAFPDLKQSALQVVLQLAWTPMKALYSESNSDVTSCSDVTSVFVHSKTPLHRREQAPVFWSCVPPLFGTSCWNFVLSLCTLQLLSIQSPVDPASSRSIIFSPPQSSQGSRTSSWWSRPLAMLSSCVAPSSESCRQIRFFQGPQLQSDAQTTPLSRGACTSAAPQKQRTKDRQRTAT